MLSKADSLTGCSLHLETPDAFHEREFLAAVSNSRALHKGWVSPPADAPSYGKYLEKVASSENICHLVIRDSGALAGVININAIIRGTFQSGYLGYYAFAPHHGQGVMTVALGQVLARAFGDYGLHRLEANIQPDNKTSLRLLRPFGFRKEGFSARYLHIDGKWRDHERWAITIEDHHRAQAICGDGNK